MGAGKSRFAPPARLLDGADPRGLGERHWSLLRLIAEHGVLNTAQVTTLMFGSRPSASRHLGALLKAGLMWRFVVDDDSTHLAYYEISTDGTRLLEQRLRDAGKPVPLALGRRCGRDQLAVNDFFVRLAAHARMTGVGHLYRWRHALDAAVWLRSRGVPDVASDGYGQWIEGSASIGFLLHIDHDEPAPLSRYPGPAPVRAAGRLPEGSLRRAGRRGADRHHDARA